MSRAQRKSSDLFLAISAIALLVLTVLSIMAGTVFLIQEWFGPATRPWKLTFMEGVVFVPVVLASLCAGLVVSVPLWTLFVRPFAPRREIRASLTYGEMFFFSWYCRKVADWLVPENGDGDASRNSTGRR